MADLPRIEDLGPGSGAISCATPNAGPAFAIAWLFGRRETEDER